MRLFESENIENVPDSSEEKNIYMNMRVHESTCNNRVSIRVMRA